MNVEGFWFSFLLSYLDCSQIWLNHGMNDCPLQLHHRVKKIPGWTLSFIGYVAMPIILPIIQTYPLIQGTGYQGETQPTFNSLGVHPRWSHNKLPMDDGKWWLLVHSGHNGVDERQRIQQM